MISTSPHSARKPQPHFFQTPVVTETPRPIESVSVASLW